MALSENFVTSCTVLDDGQIQVKVTRIIKDNGKVIAKSHERRVVGVGDDVTNENELIKEIANAIHTPERIAAYQSRINSI